MTQRGRIHLSVEERRAFAGGQDFGAVGPYGMLEGRVRVEVDPASIPPGAIADLALAPRNEHGLIVCVADVAILRPKTLSAGNRRILFDVSNRGSKRALQYLNDAPMTNRPSAPQHAGNGFLMRRGYSVVWIAWQGDLHPGDGRLILDLPVAREDGKPIQGTVRTEFVVDEPGTSTLPLSGKVVTRSHPTVSRDTTKARLTRRRYADARRELIPPNAWAFAREERGIGVDFFSEERAVVPSDTHLYVKAGFEPGWIYEIVYEGRDPLILGLGHAVIRDAIGFLRYRETDDSGNRNPLFENGQGPEKVYALGRSQTGRALRDFIYHGFNTGDGARRVFDGAIIHVAGAGRLDTSRFANLNISGSQQYEDHASASDLFPFAYARCRDPISGTSDAILKHPKTDPLIIHSQSATEYWQRRGALVHTDADGNDLPELDNVRLYLWSSSQHALDPLAQRPRRGAFENFTNIVQTSFLYRAHLDALDRWASGKGPPPPSNVPRRRDGTLVTIEEWRARFPAIPGVLLPTAPNDLDRDHPKAKSAFPVLVPATDEDGNDIAGIRAPMVAAPLGTYTGWNMRARGAGQGAMHNFDGSYIPFPETDEIARASGDPRQPILARYASPQDYVAAIKAAAEDLVRSGFMLEEDIEQAVRLAADWSRPRHDVRI